jgi:hypothetical protein
MMSTPKKAVVRIALSGSRREDLRRAQHAFRAILGKPAWQRPHGWVWHHSGDGPTLQLVPLPLHGGLAHEGGFTGTADRRVRNVGRPASPLPLTDSYGALAPSLLQELEDALDLPLPNAYRSFLLRWNGGRPRVGAFRGAESGDESLDSFLGLAPGGDDDLLAFLQLYEGRLPDRHLPIAYDAFGNLILIGLTGPQAGAIYFWDHELELAAREGIASNLQLVAHDLDAFFATFYDDGAV